jgi:hypothetical protein
MDVNKHYIIMADIIDSRDKEGQELMQTFQLMVESVNNDLRYQISSPLTITLGDEFQGVVRSLRDAIEVIIYLEEYRIKYQLDYKMRFAVHLGDIDTPINTESAHSMLGAGFIKARDMLIRLKKSGNSRYLFSIGEAKVDFNLNGLFELFTALVDGWKFSDHELIASFIRNEDYKIVAEELSLYRANTWRREKTLRISEYLLLKKLIYNAI